LLVIDLEMLKSTVYWTAVMCICCVRLTRAYNREDVTVTLPESLDVDDILWLSVWCIQFRVIFSLSFILRRVVHGLGRRFYFFGLASPHLMNQLPASQSALCKSLPCLRHKLFCFSDNCVYNTVSWSWSACTQHHVRPFMVYPNWTEL